MKLFKKYGIIYILGFKIKIKIRERREGGKQPYHGRSESTYVIKDVLVTYLITTYKEYLQKN